MRVVCISDIHAQRLKVPPGDILIVAGDFLGYGNLKELIVFNNWLETLPHKHKIVIAGNHDGVFETDYNLAKATLTNATYLQDESLILEGLKMYGSPWQPEFNDWYFNLPRGQPLKEKWDLIPTNLDILITHGPPRGILDKVVHLKTKMDPVLNMEKKVQVVEYVGCDDLREAVLKKKPRVHVFGHIHYSQGYEIIDDTLFINAAICTESYQPLNKPVVFDIDENSVKIVE